MFRSGRNPRELVSIPARMNPAPRPNRDPPSSPFAPSDEWIDALAAQCHQGLIECARRFAERRACGVRKAGHPAYDYYARELVHDAITDTAIGVLHWDPDVKTLERHVYDVIQMRTNYDLKRARKFPRESLDALTTDEESSAMAEVDAALLDRASDRDFGQPGEREIGSSCGSASRSRTASA